MNFYEFNSEQDFNIWHDNLCLSLGYPSTPINQATGLPDKEAEKTEIYTYLIKVEDRCLALVEDKYSDGLTLSDFKPKTTSEL